MTVTNQKEAIYSLKVRHQTINSNNYAIHPGRICEPCLSLDVSNMTNDIQFTSFVDITFEQWRGSTYYKLPSFELKII